MRLIYLTIVFAVIFLVAGVEQCPAGYGSGAGTQQKSGISVSLVPGVGYFSQGMKLNQGDNFKVLMNIENYDMTEKKGTICIKDNQDDAYGGIPISGECTQFSLSGAEYQSGKLIAPASQRIIFPLNGEDYSYHDIPISIDAKIYAIYFYIQHSTAQTSVNVPTPEQETLSLSQPSAPITFGVEKTVAKQQEQYKTAFGITITKQSNADTSIYSEDMKTENSVKFTARLSPTSGFAGYPLECTQQNPGTINIDSTKFIKCSALLPLEIASYPLLIYTDYGIKVTKSFDFKISKEEI